MEVEAQPRLMEQNVDSINGIQKKSQTATKMIAKENNCVKPTSASFSQINFIQAI